MTTAIEKFKEQGGDILNLRPTEVQSKLKAIDDFQKIIKSSLVPELDYGVIPGTQKPTLYKGGAEKIAKLLNLADSYEVVEKVEDWDRPFFSYTVRCTLTEMATGTVVCSYLANCNSMESKYRWRWVPQWKIQNSQNLEGVYYEERRTARGMAKFYRFDNDDVYSQINTILKMAEKRAMVSAAVSVGRLSLIFTVDMEDYKPEEPESNGEGAGRSAASTAGQGDGPANVRAPAGEAPSPKPAIVDGRYADDKYPIDAKLTLPDGTVVSVSKFKALELFENMKRVIGEERYYDVLASCKFEKASEVPVEEIHAVYSLLAGEWKKLRKKK